MVINFYLAWIGILSGIIAGAVQGSFFHNDNWLGGYDSWQRRLTRLGHISFFGLSIINLVYAFSVKSLNGISFGTSPSVLLIIGLITMPLICYSSAFIKPIRHLFFIPVLATGVGVGMFLWEVIS